MWKLLLALLLISPSAWANQWRNGTGEKTILGTSNAALIGLNSYNSIVQPLDSLLATYCNQLITYVSSSTLSVTAGSVMVSNSQGTIRLTLQNTTSTSITSANIDTGSLTSSTTYYLYAVAATNSSTSATYFFSASNTAPSGQTYYYQIGSFTTDSSTNIIPGSIVLNYIPKQTMLGTWSSKSSGTTYQALTDGFVVGFLDTAGNNNNHMTGYTDSNSSPSTLIIQAGAPSASNSGSAYWPFTMPVRKGDYWVINGNCTIYWISSGT